MLKQQLLISILASFTVVACGKQAFNENLQVSNSAIIGGSAVPADSYIAKSTVAILSAHMEDGQEVSSICTGSLLPNNFIVTAAHCIDDYMAVVFDTTVKADSEMLPVDHVAISPMWTQHLQNLQRLKLMAQQKQAITEADILSIGRNNGDIAVIHFKGNVPQGYKPATLLTRAAILRNGSEVVLAGYGISDGVNKTGDGELRFTSVKIADAKYTQTEVKLDQRKGTGACHGDSGGPAYISISGRMYLWGVTSRGIDDPKDTCGSYSAYTSIVSHSTWLKSAIAQMQKDIELASQQQANQGQN